jgi:hypothetical protein
MPTTAKDYLTSALTSLHRIRETEPNRVREARLRDVDEEIRQAMILMGMDVTVAHKSDPQPQPMIPTLEIELVPMCGKIGCKKPALFHGWVELSKVYACPDHVGEVKDVERIPPEMSNLYSNTCNGDVERPRQVQEQVPRTWNPFKVTTIHKAQGGTWEDLFKTYDGTIWQEGAAGNCNIVTFDGDNIRGVGRIDDAVLRKWVIDTFNARQKSEPQPGT